MSDLVIESSFANYQFIIREPKGHRGYKILEQSDEGDVDVVDVDSNGYPFRDKLMMQYLPDVFEPADMRAWFLRQVEAAKSMGIAVQDENPPDFNGHLLTQIVDHHSSRMARHLGIIGVKPWFGGSMLFLLRMLDDETFQERFDGMVSDIGTMRRLSPA